MQKITPFLWYADQAEEAASFYVSLFKNSRITKTTRYPEDGTEVTGRPPGSVMTVEFELEGQRFTALNGGPVFKFDEAISFTVNCDTQEEIDYFWEKLIAGGGQESQCGWLKDKFGLSWQITPAIMTELWESSDPERNNRVMNAMLQMKKLDIAKLKAAYDGSTSATA
jgi:predicted 3-demethylubiquinone-9 3-methyltransferase (glyoxalase superfamily)